MKTFKIVLFVIFLVPFISHAEIKRDVLNNQELAALTQQASIEQQQFDISQKKLTDLQKIREQQLTAIKPKNVNRQMLERADLNLAVAQADFLTLSQSIQEIQDKLVTIKNLINHFTDRLQELHVTTLETSQKNAKITALQAEIDYQQALFNIQTQRLVILKKTHHNAKEVVKLEQAWVEKLSYLYKERKTQQREEAMQRLATTVQEESKTWLEKLSTLNQQLEQYTAEQRFTDPDAILLSVKIFHAQESLYLSRLRFEVARLQEIVTEFGNNLQQKLPLQELDKLLAGANQLSKQADTIRQQLSAKQNLLEEQLNISHQSQEQGVITGAQLKEQINLYSSLISEYSKIRVQLDPIRKKINDYKNKTTLLLNEAIAERQGLPGFNGQAWLTLFKNVSNIPQSLLGMFHGLKDQLVLAFHNIDASWIALIILLEILWISIWVISQHFLRSTLQSINEKRQKTSINTTYVFLKLFQHNSWNILITVGICLLLILSGVSYQSYRLFLYFVFIWIAYHVIDDLARFSLLASSEDQTGQDVRLYQRLKWMLRLGAILTGLTVLVNELNSAYDVRDIVNRLFMLFLLALSVLLFRSRKVIPTLLHSYTKQSRPYVRRLIALMSTLIPLTIFSNAITGLIGYVQLAWVMSYYQAIFLLVLAAFIIMRGLLVDLLGIISDLSIRYLQNGWLLSQAFIKPLNRIVGFAAAIAAIILLFYAYGWGTQSLIVTKIYSIFYHPLYYFREINSAISLASIIEFIILVSVVFWAARWTREFSYRWVYSGFADLGLRNSLAIFSQYATIAIGIIITLRVVGIDVSGLSYILGGLAVGLGFGLRDFANNIVSGVLMLIERPIREGDIVTVGGFEGTIIHMGVRSSMLKSWDNMEVLLPNSEIYNKTFTNWTLQDNTIRTVINIKIQRSNEPAEVVKLITDLLFQLPEILKDPEPHVYLHEIDKALIEIEVRYFINVQENSRAEVRSKVLLAIVELFKKHNILPPYTSQEVELRMLKDEKSDVSE